MPARAIALEEGLEGTPRLVAKGETIFSRGERVASVYKLVSGCLRTTRVLGDGFRLIDAFYFPGDILGLQFGGVHRVSAETVSDSSFIVYDAERLNGTREVDRQLREQIDRGTLSGLERAQRHILLLGRKTPAERLALFLLQMSQRLASGGASFLLPMDRVDIADHLGTTTETVSRMMTRFVREGLLEAMQKQVTLLDRPRLEAMVRREPLTEAERAA